MSRAVVLLACSTTLMGCIVTRDLDYEPPPNYPPSVRGADETPTDVLYRRMLPSAGDPDAGVGPMELTLRAVVSDPNVDQELEALLFVNRHQHPLTPGDAFVRAYRIPANENGALERATPLLDIPDGDLDEGCNIVQLHVSRAFDITTFEPRPFPNEPTIDDLPDLGKATWFVLGTTSDTPSPSLDMCPRPPEAP